MSKRLREEKQVGFARKSAKKHCAKSQPALLSIPTVCLSLIFSFLDIRFNFSTLRQVCHAFEAVAKQPFSLPPAIALDDWDVAPGKLVHRIPSGYAPSHLEIDVMEGLDHVFKQISPAKLVSLRTFGTDNTRLLSSFLGKATQLKSFDLVNARAYVIDHLLMSLCAPSFELTTLSLRMYVHDKSTDELVQSWSSFALASLQSLTMEGHQILRTQVMSIVKASPRLKTLRMSFKTVDKDTMFTLLHGLPELERLSLEIFGETEPGVLETSLLRLQPEEGKNLRTVGLCMYYRVHMTWRSVARLAFHNLENLVLRGINPQQVECKRIAEEDELLRSRAYCNLTSLNLDGEWMDNTFLRDVFTKLPQLGRQMDSLYVQEFAPHDPAIFASIGANFPVLTDLSFDGEVNDKDIAHISSLAQLSSVSLDLQNVEDDERSVQLTAACFPHFTAMKSLTHAVLRLGHLRTQAAYKAFCATCKERDIELYV